MENEREDYIVGVVRIIRGLYVSGTMSLCTGITYCFYFYLFIFLYLLLTSSPPPPALSLRAHITSCHFI